MRMIDRIRKGDLEVPSSFKDPVQRDLIKRIRLDGLRRAQVMVATNVASFVYTTKAGQQINLQEDLPNLAPPFENFFVEWDDVDDVLGEIGTVGVHFREKDAQYVRAYLGARKEKLPEGFRLDQCEFVVLAELYLFKRGHRNVRGPMMALMLFLDREGMVLEDPPTVLVGVRVEDFEASPQLRKTCNLLRPLFIPGFYAVCFTHCKNVRQEAGEEISEKMRKAYQRRYHQELVRYKTLVIDPMRRVLHREGGYETHGNIKQALHICRGHFKNFKEGRGLFGKLKGTYFWHQQVRGSSAEGEVVKDYEVKEPVEV